MADSTQVAPGAAYLPSPSDVERAAAFTREPFVAESEEAATALAFGTARRMALDAALAELDAGLGEPSIEWRRQWSLLLGLERLLVSDEPELVDGTVLSAHQVDALSGTLTALLADIHPPAPVHEELPAPANGELPAPSAGPAAEELADLEDDEDADEEPQDWSDEAAEDEAQLPEQPEDPNAGKRFWFEHATGAGKTVAALGFVEASRTGGVLILTHRRNLVDQFHGELRDRGYSNRITPPLLRGQDRANGPVTVETYQWFVRNAGNVSDAYTIVICDEAHTALGEKTSASIRRWAGPIFIGMTATGALIARHVTDLFPTQTSRFDLGQAARRGVISPLRCIRIPPGPGVRTIAKVPLRRGDVDVEFDQEMLAELLDQLPFNLAIADLYKTRFDSMPGVVYAAGVRHAYNVAQAFRDNGLKAQAVSGETPKRDLAQILADYERGDVDVLVNAQLLAEGWNSPRATVCLHLAPTASRRIYQQRVGRVTRRHPGKESGIVVDFVHPATRHDDPVVTLHSLLDRDVYRGGAIVVGPVRRGRGRRLRVERRVLPVTADENRRIEVFERELWRIAVEHLDWGEQVQWAALAGARVQPTGWRRARAMLHFDQAGELRRAFLLTALQRNKHAALRLRALQEIAALRDADAFDGAIEAVGGWPREEKREAVKVVLTALAEKKIGRRDQANNWIWHCAEYTREVHEEYAVQRWPETKRLLGLLVNSSGGAHARNARRLVHASRNQDRRLSAALLAAAVPHTAEAGEVVNGARTRMSRKPAALARELLRNFPKGKGGAAPSKRTRTRKRKGTGEEVVSPIAALVDPATLPEWLELPEDSAIAAAEPEGELVEAVAEDAAAAGEEGDAREPRKRSRRRRRRRSADPGDPAPVAADAEDVGDVPAPAPVATADDGAGEGRSSRRSRRRRARSASPDAEPVAAVASEAGEGEEPPTVTRRRASRGAEVNGDGPAEKPAGRTRSRAKDADPDSGVTPGRSRRRTAEEPADETPAGGVDATSPAQAAEAAEPAPKRSRKRAAKASAPVEAPAAGRTRKRSTDGDEALVQAPDAAGAEAPAGNAEAEASVTTEGVAKPAPKRARSRAAKAADSPAAGAAVEAPAPKPVRARRAKPAATVDGGGDAVEAPAPKRTRARAAKPAAVADAPAVGTEGDAPAPKRTRARAAKAAPVVDAPAVATEGDAPAPKRTRARAAKAAPVVDAPAVATEGDAPAPKRTRARAAKAAPVVDAPAVATEGDAPAPKRTRARAAKAAPVEGDAPAPKPARARAAKTADAPEGGTEAPAAKRSRAAKATGTADAPAPKRTRARAAKDAGTAANGAAAPDAADPSRAEPPTPSSVNGSAGEAPAAKPKAGRSRAAKAPASAKPAAKRSRSRTAPKATDDEPGDRPPVTPEAA